MSLALLRTLSSGAWRAARRFARPIVAVVVLVGLSACRTEPTNSAEAEREMVLAASQERQTVFNETVRRGDAEFLADQFSWDAYVLRPDAPDLRKGDLFEYFRAYLASNPRVAFVPEEVEVASSFDMAVEVGAMVEERNVGDDRIRQRSRYLNVWSKVGGTWRIEAESVVHVPGTFEVIGPAIVPIVQVDSISATPSDSAR